MAGPKKSKEPNPQELSLALDKLAQYLSRRSHSKKELEQKLCRHFSQAVVQQALKQAKEKSWLEDPMDIALKTAEVLHKKKKSWAYIKQYLRKKDLPLPEYDPEREKEKIQQLLSKKNPDWDKKKCQQFLSYRGFDIRLLDELVES